MENEETGPAISGTQDDPQAQSEAGTTTQPEPGMEALLREEEFAFRRLRRGETVEGTVVRVDPDEVLVDIGMKSEGVIPARELSLDGENAPASVSVGDNVLVYVLHPEGHEGHPILSLRRAEMERAWREIENFYRQGTIVEAPIVDFNKGGLIAEVQGIRGFIPVSQVLQLRNIGRQEGEGDEIGQVLGGMVGQRLPLKVIEINRSRNRLILSERSAVQDRRSQRKDELMDQLAPGQVRHGVVSNLTGFGAFIDLGGADGLVHVSELSYNRVNHPSDVLQVGQEVDVTVLDVDRDTRKIALSLKQAQPDPWATLEERYNLGQVIPATITKLAKFGAFAKVENGLEGLIHLTELTDLPVRDPSEVVKEGQQIEAKIIHINSQRRRLGLSLRQTAPAQKEVESFGEVEANTPFATQDFGMERTEEEEEEEGEVADQTIEATSPESTVSIEEERSENGQQPGAVEWETEEVTATEPATPEVPEEAVPESVESTPSEQEEPEPEIASTAPQATASE